MVTVPIHNAAGAGGRTTASPPCPTCGATGRRCLRPSGHEAQRWHNARETALAQLCGCAEVCIPWLEKHGGPG